MILQQLIIRLVRMLIEQNRILDEQYPPKNMIYKQSREDQYDLTFQQFSNNHQLLEATSNKLITIKLISISLLILITALILMMGNVVQQNSDLLNKIINKHIDNKDLQDEFENRIINITYALRQIKIMSIQQNQEQDNRLYQLKGIIKKYQTSINQIELFLTTPQIQIDGQLKKQAKNLIDIFKSKSVLQELKHQKSKQKAYNFLVNTVNKEYKLSIPKNIWIFKEKPFNYIRKLVIQNRIHYANISGYNVHFVNYESMKTYLPKLIENNIIKGIDLLSKRLSGQLLHLSSKKLILLGFLQTHGGIMIDGIYPFTEDLSWIEDIINNKFVIKGNRYAQPKIIAFYNPLQSPQKQKFNIMPFEGMEESDKFILEYPKIQEYFIAASKGTQFLQDLIRTINELISDIDNFWKYTKKYSLKYDRIEDFSKNIIFVASRIILVEKQRKLDENNKGNYKIFALDYYGLNSINANYGPSKSSIIFEQNIKSIVNLQSYYHMLFHDLAHSSYNQLRTYIGEFKYICSFNFQYYLNSFIEKSSKDKDIQIYQGSFIQKVYYPQKKHGFIIQNPQKIFINETNQSWDSLDKIIWIFQTTTEKSQWTKICIDKVKQIATSSDFQVRLINDDNIELYLQKQTIFKIKNIISKSTLNIPNIKYNLYRLAILYQYGGICIEQSTIVVENLDWIINIGKYQSEYIFNRVDALPKVLMMFNPFTRSQQKWNIHPLAKDKSIKTQWHQELLDDILVAQEGSQFIGQWLDMIFQILKLKNYQIQELYRKNRVGQHKTSDWVNQNLFFTDVAKFILGRKQIMLQKQQNRNYINSAHYYKLWTINAYITPFKLKNNLHYQSLNQSVNSYLFKFPLQTVESIIGKIHFLSSIAASNESFLDEIVRQNKEQIHLQSLINFIIANNKQ